jgi:hypothetical protein
MIPVIQQVIDIGRAGRYRVEMISFTGCMLFIYLLSIVIIATPRLYINVLILFYPIICGTVIGIHATYIDDVSGLMINLKTYTAGFFSVNVSNSKYWIVWGINSAYVIQKYVSMKSTIDAAITENEG